MIIPILLPIISALAPMLVPALVKKALPKVILNAEEISKAAPEMSGDDKKLWVLNFFSEMEELLASRGLLSPRVRAVVDQILPTLADRIEIELERLKAKGKIPA